MPDKKNDDTGKSGQTEQSHARARGDGDGGNGQAFKRDPDLFSWEADERITSRSCRRVRRVLELLTGHGVISTACRQAGLSRTQFAEFRNRHPALDLAVEVAIDAAVADTEAIAFACAKMAIKDPRYLKALEMVLKCKGGWRETQRFEHTGEDGGPIRQTIDLSGKSTADLERLLTAADAAGVTSEFDRRSN